MHIEDAERLIIRWIRQKTKSDHSDYGYDIYLSNIIRCHLRDEETKDRQAIDHSIPILWPIFASAAWELCRRGIIRPGVPELRSQATEHGSAGEGYSVTPFGEQWVAESDRDDYVPTEPQRFAQMVAPYQQRFGSSFQERAQEAIRCYGAHAYLACCTMCGAAAEAILLATAIAKHDHTHMC